MASLLLIGLSPVLAQSGPPPAGGCFSFGAGVGMTALAAVFGGCWLIFLISGYTGLMPGVMHMFTRWINNKAFLQEYERRLDGVVEHDVHKKYRFGRKLGEGVTSAVYRVQEKDSGQYFAMKKIPLKHSSSLQRAVEREMKILKKLRHRNITSLHDVFTSPNRVWAILEFVSGGELTHFICMNESQWDESLAVRCAYQVLGALAYLHHQGVVHRDIKLANILRSSKTPNFTMKVADFGAACIMNVPEDPDINAESLKAFKAITDGKECIGTPCNMAPEVRAV